MTDPTRSESGSPPQTAAHDTADTRTPGADATVPVPQPAVPTPRGFEILRELGRGGMGVVYLARQTALNRLVALKMVRGYDRADSKSLIRFLAEAEVVAAVRHPHVVQVYEYGQHDDCPYMALEYLPGGSLDEKLGRGKKLDPRAAAALVAKLAAAVHAAHALGIVHRDLKTGNVLFDERGEPKVTDFGLAKRDSSDLTRTQAIMGTPAYMAPEQASGQAKFVGPPADVWALGVILYEAAAGTRPFQARDIEVLLAMIRSSEPDSPRRACPGLPRDLELITLKCLDKDPARRYPTAGALAEDLGRFLAGQPVGVRPAGTVEKVVKWCRRNPVVTGFGLALALVAAAGFTGVTWGFVRAEIRGRELARANTELNTTLADLNRSRNALAESEADAARRAEEAEASGYISDIALASRLWHGNDFRGLRATLDRCPEKRRKWEWHYLDRLSRPAAEVIPTASPATALGYSPDGSLLVYLTTDGVLTARETAVGKDRFRIETEKPPPSPAGPIGFPTEKYQAVAFRPDGKELAYLFGGRVWAVELTTGARRELTPGPMNIVTLGYTTRGQLRVAVEGAGGAPRRRTFAVVELPGARTVRVLAGGPEPEGWVLATTAAEFSPGGEWFAAIVVDTGTRNVSLSGGKVYDRVVPPPNPVPPAPPEPAPPPRLVGPGAAGGNDIRIGPPKGLAPTFTLWAVPIGDGMEYRAGGALVAGIAYTAGEVFYTDDLTVNLVGLPGPGGGELSGIRHHARAYALAVGGRLLFSGGEGRDLTATWATPEPRSIQARWRGFAHSVLRVAATADGKWVAVSDADPAGGPGWVRVFDVAATRAEAWQADYPDNVVGYVPALSPAGDRFVEVTLGDLRAEKPDTRVAIRDAAGRVVREVRGGASALPTGAFRPDGTFALVTDPDRIRVIAADGGERTFPLDDAKEMTVVVPAWSPDGRALAAVSAGRADRDEPAPIKVTVYDTAGGGVTRPAAARVGPVARDGEEVWVFPTAVAFDATGQRLAAALSGMSPRPAGDFRPVCGAVVVWDLATGRVLLHAPTPHPLRAVAFDPDGRVVGGGGPASEGRVTAWDVETGREVYSFVAHTRPVTALAFGPDRRLATASAEHAVKVWDYDTRRELLLLLNWTATHLAWTPDDRLVSATGLDLTGQLLAGVSTLDKRPPPKVIFHRGGK